MRIAPVILCGGSGSRLWPLSRTQLPKQFLPLLTERTMLQETALRVGGMINVGAPLVVCNEAHRFLAAEQLRGIGVAPAAHILETQGRNTAPAVAAAALALRETDADAVMLVLPADHLIRDDEEFRRVVTAGAALAAQGRLVTFGIVPDAPATGYGYIRRGEPEPQAARAYRVAQFVEKPDEARARAFLADGGFYWNSGMFMFTAARYLEELARYRADIHDAAARAMQAGRKDLDFWRLDAEEFARCPSESVDYAVMEKTRHACVIEGNFGWSDIGSWSALWEAQAKDAQGNVVRGDVFVDRTEGCYLRADGRLLAAVGVQDLVVVETDDAVLVAHKDYAQDVKQTVEVLKAQKRAEHVSHRRVFRPWGYYESIDAGERFQVKRLMVRPGAKLSLQRHRQRAEHWVVVSGRARVTRGEEELLLGPDQSAYIPLGAKHRLENAGAEPLFVIEVQSGGYLGEDDIERFADDYRRG